MRSGSLRESEGSVLIITLWILFVVAILGIQYSKMSRMESLLLIHGGERAKARYAALAGVEKSAALLKFWNGKEASGNASSVLWPLGNEIELPPEGDVRVKVEVEDEGDKLNINTAKADEIADYLVNAGMEDDRALTVADSIVDWRDRDNNRLSHGAEASDYKAMGRNYKPPNRPFETIFELPLVNGVDWESFWVDPGLFNLFTIYGSKKKEEAESDNATGEISMKLDEGEVYRFTVQAEAAKITARVTAWLQYRGGKFYMLEKRIW